MSGEQVSDYLSLIFSDLVYEDFKDSGLERKTDEI